MPVLKSALDVTTAKFAANRQAMSALVSDLRARTAEAALGGPEDSRKRHTERGKLLPASGSNSWSIPAALSWRSGRSPPMACMTVRPQARA